MLQIVYNHVCEDFVCFNLALQFVYLVYQLHIYGLVITQLFTLGEAFNRSDILLAAYPLLGKLNNCLFRF